MRSILLAVAFMPAAASVAQSQQAKPLAPKDAFAAQSQQVVVGPTAAAPRLGPVDAPAGITRARAGVDAAQSNQLTKSSAATVDPGTRNVLAIVGAVVIVLALIAFVL